MSAITPGTRRPRRARGHRGRGRATGPRADDPRVVRSRAAVVEAARALFLAKGHAGTTMEEIAAAAGLTKRTLYNNYADKDQLFTRVVADVISYAEAFARGLHDELGDAVTAANLRATLDDLAQRMARMIVRPDIVALRRLLVAESRVFPALAAEYFDRAPGQVLEALATGFARLGRGGLLAIADPHRAAAQFAYLVVGEPLDRAMLTGVLPPAREIGACAREGVETFLARYTTARQRIAAKPKKSA
jgi:AcrR family transcriptional regulator